MDGLIRGLFIYAWVLQNISQPAALACQHTGTNNPFRNNVFSSIRHVSRLAWFFSGHFVRSTLPCFLFGLAFYPPFCPLICHVSYLVWLYSYHSFRFTLPFLMFGLAFYPPFCPLYSAIFLICFGYSPPIFPLYFAIFNIWFGFFSRHFVHFTLPFFHIWFGYFPTILDVQFGFSPAILSTLLCHFSYLFQLFILPTIFPLYSAIYHIWFGFSPAILSALLYRVTIG